ncbi:MAG: DUF1850 domain-containing protein [Hydrogenophaga sp.]|nr:DUF1850 domain-containing protein [Hydrogenophaga sp.]
MSLCLATPLMAVGLAVQSFTLAWTHSVERTEWKEAWRVQGEQLVLEMASVRGSGAGMEPPDGSVLREGWWVYRRPLAVPELNLAVSGATVDGWRLCTDDGACKDLETWLGWKGQRPQAIRIRPRAEAQDCRPIEP